MNRCLVFFVLALACTPDETSFDAGSDASIAPREDASPDANAGDPDSGPLCDDPADEVCDGEDNDCDGDVDDELDAPSCPLQDGVCMGSARRCGGLAGFIACSGIESYGGDYQAEETICDELDNDCDASVDEGCACVDGGSRACGSDVGECEMGTQRCAAGAWGPCSGVASAPEICDGRDNDCNERNDDGLEAPACELTAGVCTGARQTCLGLLGWAACDASSYGEDYEEVETSCDGLDNDCDGAVDDVETPSCALTLGVCAGSVASCDAGGIAPCSAASYGEDYEAIEASCDGLDNDCDGSPDDALSAPSCALTHGVCAGTRQSCGGASGWVACSAPSYGEDYEAFEVSCDGLDNDCDGTPDEGCGCSVPGDDCAASEICACPSDLHACAGSGSCVPVFGSFAIQIDSATLPSVDPAGECWDAPCGNPDPYIEVYVGGAFVGTTGTRTDTRFPTWPPDTFRTTIASDATIRFDVYDEDIAIDDFGFMARSPRAPPPCARARSRARPAAARA